VTKQPQDQLKTTMLNETTIPTLQMGPRGKDALRNFVEQYPPSQDEELESHETGASLLAALGRGGNDADIEARLLDMGFGETMDATNRVRRERHVDLHRRRAYHAQAQQYKQSNTMFVKMMNGRLKLPAYQHYDAVVQTVANNPITIISGETGCGRFSICRFFISFLLLVHPPPQRCTELFIPVYIGQIV
jgi:hypothetical protein